MSAYIKMKKIILLINYDYDKELILKLAKLTCFSGNK